jgi:hypothetical protein
MPSDGKDTASGEKERRVAEHDCSAGIASRAGRRTQRRLPPPGKICLVA